MNKFRFGLVAGHATDMDAWTGMARQAESLGYSTLLIPDTLYTPAPLVALSAAAAATTTLRLGTWVLCDPLRNQQVLAWEAGTLHALSGGRFELGIGAGRPGAERDAERLGIPYGSGAERVQRLTETLRLLKEGTDAPRIMVAGSGPRMLALAAREADTVAFAWQPDTTEEVAKERIDTVRRAAPDRFDNLELAAGLVAVGDDAPPWLAQQGIDPGELARQGAVTVLTGTPRQMADTLLHRRDALGISYVVVPGHNAQQLAPVVAELAGR